tara:strand:+ start:174 stop:293 length:120 start_codon:yes stop_codon:yes gene_type:complete
MVYISLAFCGVISMVAILAILLFVVVIFLLNKITFGRFD